MDWTELLANYSLVSNNRRLGIFLEDNNREGEGLEDVFRDIGFTENSMLYPS